MDRKMLRWPGFRLRAVTLSYDDGTVTDRRLIETMDRYGLLGTFNLNSGLFPATSGGVRLTREEALALYGGSRHEVAVHGARHLSLPTVPASAATLDVIEDRVALEAMFGTLIEGMAYAYGTYSDEVVEILRGCGIRYARTVTATCRFDLPTDWLRMPTTCHHKNPRLTELVHNFLGAEEGPNSRPMLFYLWGHSSEFERDGNWEIIENFGALIGGRENVFYATNGEIYRYVTAFDSLVFSANGTVAHNPTATDVYVFCFGKNTLIPAGATVAL